MKDIITFDCEVYLQQVVFYYGESIKPICKFLKGKITDEELNALIEYKRESGFSVRYSGGYNIIWLNKKPNTHYTLSVLHHEIFHCVCSILRYVGVEFSNKSEEAYAYLFGHISKKIYEGLNIKIQII